MGKKRFDWTTVAGLPQARQDMAAVELIAVQKVYATSAGEFAALKGADLTVAQGEFVAVVGKSGSGKSTLINMITGIDRPTNGEVWVAGMPVHTLTENQIAVWRGRVLGVVFQFFQLLPTLTALENVMLPMDFCHVYDKAERPRRAYELLGMVGVGQQADKLPAADSSNGWLLPALWPTILHSWWPMSRPAIWTAGRRQRLLLCLMSWPGRGKTIIMVTHDQDLARQSSRIVTVAEGGIAADGRPGERDR